jgi:flagellar basal-body rod modification protein FlgD
MTMIPSTSGVSGSSPATGAATTSSDQSGLNQLDNSQTFLQLLVAQLKNQDPTNPADPTTFMTEIAQLTAVQSQTSLAAEEQTVAADSMIGLTVTGSGSLGAAVTGQVSGVLLSSSGAPTLEVDDGTGQPQDLSLTSITSVTQTAPSTPADPATPATPATTPATPAAPAGA